MCKPTEKNKSLFNYFEPYFDLCSDYEIVVRIDSINPELRVGVDIPLVDLKVEDTSSSGAIFCVKGMCNVENALTANTLTFSALKQRMEHIFAGDSIDNVLLLELDSKIDFESLMLSVGHIEPEIDIECKVVRFKMTGRGACRIKDGVVFTRPLINDLSPYSSS